jgi:F0F1-type ATP synthase membrane subunit a
LILLLAGFGVMFTIPPIIPVIQLPGEHYPAGILSVFGLDMTNSLMGSIIVWILLILLALYVNRARPKGSNEVPRGGFYNVFEALFEGLYNFVRGIVGERYLRYIFSFFMTIFLIVLLSNWIELVPGVDSIGFMHPRVEQVDTDENPATPPELQYLAGYEVNPAGGSLFVLDPKCPWVDPATAATLSADAQAARAANGCSTGTGAVVTTTEGEHIVVEEATTEGHEIVATEVAVAGSDEAAAVPTAEVIEGAAHGEAADVAAVEGAAATSPENAGEQVEEHAEIHVEPGSAEVPWHIVPFLRAPSTDLNMTASLALIAVIMTQVIGFRALGAGYLTKFFNFRTLLSSPLGGIDVAVGLLELIGEFARILSFAFRLLGNIFAGSILLFVMSFLLPFLPWPFFILEFFVGVIQAIVFAMLTAIFMNLATQGHAHEDEHQHHDEDVPVEASTVGELAEAH